MPTSSPTSNHYHQDALLESILDALYQRGISSDQLTRQHLAGLDEFHLQGAYVSKLLSSKLALRPGQAVLDVGCGVGGPCRMLADEYQVNVTGIDYTEAYILTAKALTEMVGLSDLVTYTVGNALDLPYAEDSFDAVWTQHVQMNIEDKGQFYSEIGRVLKPGGRFLYYDVFTLGNGEVFFPVPWAELPESSHLISHTSVLDYFPATHWRVLFQEEHTANAQSALEKALINPLPSDGPPLGLNLLMRETTREKLRNLLRCLSEGKINVFAGMLQKQ